MLRKREGDRFIYDAIFAMAMLRHGSLDLPGVTRCDHLLRFYDKWDRAMKTTIEISDALYRRAKSEAALRGRKVKDLVEEGLRLVLETPRRSPRRQSLAELMGAHTERWTPVSRTSHLIPNTSRTSAAIRRAILDTGPLIAFLDRAEQNHRWAVEQVEELEAPLLVCEPVLAEATRANGYRFAADVACNRVIVGYNSAGQEETHWRVFRRERFLDYSF
jgi:hypothetical protein